MFGIYLDPWKICLQKPPRLPQALRTSWALHDPPTVDGRHPANHLSNWWAWFLPSTATRLLQPIAIHFKYSSQLGSFPSCKGWKNTYLKPPPRQYQPYLPLASFPSHVASIVTLLSTCGIHQAVFSLGFEVEAINSQLRMHDAKKLTWNIWYRANIAWLTEEQKATLNTILQKPKITQEPIINNEIPSLKLT